MSCSESQRVGFRICGTKVRVIYVQVLHQCNMHSDMLRHDTCTSVIIHKFHKNPCSKVIKTTIHLWILLFVFTDWMKILCDPLCQNIQMDHPAVSQQSEPQTSHHASQEGAVTSSLSQGKVTIVSQEGAILPLSLVESRLQ